MQSLVNEVEAMRQGHKIPFNWDTTLYTNPQRRVEPTIMQMSEQERTEYDSILHRQAVDKLFRITNGERLEMDELEELSMLIARADPNDSNHYPFWVAEVGKQTKILTALCTTECRCAGSHPSNAATTNLPR